MVKLSAPITPAWLAAQERALADRAAGRRPVRIGPNTYRVPSSRTAETYTVVIRNAGALDASCDCEHGRTGGKGHCRHIASALMAELERVSRPTARTSAAEVMARAFRP